MFREDHTRSRSRSRDAAIVLVPPLLVFFASRCHLPPPNIWLALIWLVLRIVLWALKVAGVVCLCPSKGDDSPTAPAKRAMHLSSVHHRTCEEGSSLRVGTCRAALPSREKLCLHRNAPEAGISLAPHVVHKLRFPASRLPHCQMCTRYGAATAQSRLAGQAICWAPLLFTLLCSEPGGAHCYTLCITCVAYTLAAIPCSAQCLCCLQTRWTRAVSSGRASEAHPSISHSRMLPSLFTKSLSGQSMAQTAFTLKSRLGPKSQGLLSLYLRVLLLFLSIHTARAGQQPEARVATPAAVVAGGDGASISTPLSALSSKPGGFPITTRPALNVTQTRSAKRAYQRACNRAIRFGQTRYRGRTLLASQVPQANRHTALTSITKTH